ncbi:SGNH/GDSL hydrolase family protein [Desulfonatronum thioautotrophicum]|uniref:SGNH/GDSL hydrolase family protein n=1 Tax=Desulfonatronum thioautotrophicum TaxID=617001 RepID=UPI00069AB373|nr:GDSL-type esterase/lipase family protein [Desulfonatronum thioautotrophicum]
MIPVLLAFLVGSLLLNLLLIRQCRNAYLNLHATRLDGLGQMSFQEQAPAFPDDRPVVLFFGDSRAAAWPAPTLAQADVQIINRGIGGQTTSQVRCRFDQHVLELDVDVLVLQVGVNDLRAIPAFPDQQERILQQTVTNINWMVERASKKDIQVVITTIFPLGKLGIFRTLFWKDTVSDAILTVNTHLLDLAGPNVHILDSGSILADAHGVVHRRYSADYLHINHRGYAALNSKLVSILDGLDLVAKTTPNNPPSMPMLQDQ